MRSRARRGSICASSPTRISPRWPRADSRPRDSAVRRTPTSALAGALSRPDAVVALNGRHVLVAGVPPTDFDAALRVAGLAATLTSLAARMAGGTISASGQAELDGPGAVRPSGRTWISPRSCATPERSNRSRPRHGSTARIDGQWTAPALAQLQLTARAQAVNGVPAPRGTLPVDGTVAFTLHGQQWELTTDDIGTEGARLRGSVSGAVNATIPAKSSIGGSIHAGAADVRELIAVVARAGVIQKPVNVSGAVSGDFVVSGQVGAPSLDGPVVATIDYESLKTATVRARRADRGRFRGAARDRRPARRVKCAGRGGVVEGNQMRSGHDRRVAGDRRPRRPVERDSCGLPLGGPSRRVGRSRARSRIQGCHRRHEFRARRRRPAHRPCGRPDQRRSARSASSSIS